MHLARNMTTERVRMQTLALLNRHLAAAVVLQDRIRRAPRSVPGEAFLLIDGLSDQVARVLETCVRRIAARVADMGGTPEWPLRPDGAVSLRIFNPLLSETPPEVLKARPGTPDGFGQSVLDAATMAQAFGDATTTDRMSRICRSVAHERRRAATARRRSIPACAV